MISSMNSLQNGKQAINQSQILDLEQFSDFNILKVYKWKSHMHGHKKILYFFTFFGKNGSHHDLVFQIQHEGKKSCLKLGFFSDGLSVSYFNSPYQKISPSKLICACQNIELLEANDIAYRKKKVSDLIFYLNTLTDRVYHTGISKDQWDCQNFARTVQNYLLKNCEKGHQLGLAYTLPNPYPQNKMYKCNMCKLNYQCSKKQKVLRCNFCMYDICPNCATSTFPKPEIIFKCKKNHELVFIKHSKPFRCNKCCQIYMCNKNFQTLRCGACDYDICYACHKIK